MAQLMLINPAKRPSKRKGKSTMAKKRRTNKRKTSTRRKPARRLASTTTSRTTKRYRRNPSARRGMAGMMKDLGPSIAGGAGALALDVGMNYLPLPAALKTGPVNLAVRGVAAIALGMLAQNFMRKDTANNLARGALTVIAYDGMKQVAKTAMPQLPLNGAFEDDDPFMGAYLEEEGMGYVAPSVQMDDFDDGMGAYLQGEFAVEDELNF